MQLWHLTFAADRRHVLFPTDAGRRKALRRVFDLTAAELVLYSLVDDHLHLVVLCDEARAAALLRSIHLALRAMVHQVIDTDRRPVEGRSHLIWLLRYHLEQVVRHGLKVHPALWEGSCFQDLVGARCITDLGSRLEAVLPRLDRHEPHELVGLPRQDIVPCTDAQVRAAGAHRVARAAGVSLLAQPSMKGRGALEILSKRTVARLVGEAGIPTSELAWLFGQDARSIRRWRREPVEPEITRAVRVRLALEDLVASLGLEAWPAAARQKLEQGVSTVGGARRTKETA